MKLPYKVPKQDWEDGEIEKVEEAGKTALEDIETTKKLTKWAIKQLKNAITKDHMKIAMTIPELVQLARSSEKCAWCNDSINWQKKPYPTLINIEPCKELEVGNSCLVCDECKATFLVFSLSQVKEMRGRQQ